jgi:hypothetical protein
MEVRMKSVHAPSLIGLAILTFAATIRATPAVQQTADVNRGLGRWSSIERFEGEPRISVSLRNAGPSIEGWAVLLGQRRRSDDRATLGLSFANATWSGQSFRFSTILPEDEGTIGWELRVTTATTAVLTALTEDGQPMQDQLKWDMTR